MVEEASRVEVYQLHVWIRGISPMIWRRLLVRADSTIADLHYTLQIAFDWSDLHLHRFHIHGQDYGISRIGGLSFSCDPHSVRLSDFQFRLNERFLYEYDFGDRWEHEVRVEQRLPLEAKNLPGLHWRAASRPGGRLRWPMGLHGIRGRSLVSSAS